MSEGVDLQRPNGLGLDRKVATRFVDGQADEIAQDDDLLLFGGQAPDGVANFGTSAAFGVANGRLGAGQLLQVRQRAVMRDVHEPTDGGFVGEETVAAVPGRSVDVDHDHFSIVVAVDE